MPDNDDDLEAWPFAPPEGAPARPSGPPAAGYPGQGDPVAPVYAPETPRRRSPRALLGLLVGVVAIVGGAAFAVTQLAGDEGSPEGAVEKLFDAIAEEDLLGVLEALPPSERDALRQPLQDLAGELKRLEILSGDLDLNNLSGLDASFEDLRFESEPLAENLATVKIVGGTSRLTTNPAELPLGDFVRDQAGESLSSARPTTETGDVASDDSAVTVKEDGRWYVSLWYSVAEAARKSAGAALPDFSQRVVADGGDSPQAAVEALIRGAVTLDLRRLIALLPPDEARALHDYAPLFLDEAEQAVAEIRQLFQVDITALELAATEDGDRALVQIRKLEFDARLANGEFAVSYRDGCATLSGPGGEQERLCGEDLQKGGVPGLLGPLTGGDVPHLDVEQPDLGFVTVRRDGEWYLSPTRTVIDNVTAFLKVLERDDLDQLAEFVAGFIGFAS